MTPEQVERLREAVARGSAVELVSTTDIRALLAEWEERGTKFSEAAHDRKLAWDKLEAIACDVAPRAGEDEVSAVHRVVMEELRLWAEAKRIRGEK